MGLHLSPGVWGVLATPFTGQHTAVDRAGLTTLAACYEAVGAAGLTVLGVFGEAARLSLAERAQVLSTVRDAVGLPLVAGATSLATAPLVEEVRAVQETAGDRLAAVMVQVNSAVPAVLRQHLVTLHEATGVAVVVQDYPLVSGVSMPPGELAGALRGLPFLAAVKAESPPTAVSVATLAAALDAPVFGGLGGLGLLDELAAGAAGAMTGYSFPEGLVACVAAFTAAGGRTAGGFAAARESLLPHLPLIAFEQQPGIGLALRKACLQRRGLIADAAVRPPAPGVPSALQGQVARHVDMLTAALPTSAGAR